MRKLKLFKQPRFNVVIVIVLIAAAVGLEVIAPAMASVASQKAKTLAARAQKEAPVHPNQALIDYRVAKVLSPSNHDIAQNLASLYLKLDRPDDAIAELRRLPKAESGAEIADILRQSGRLGQALQALDGLDNSDPEILLLKSKILLEQGHSSDAADAARQALSLYPGNPRTQLQLGLCQAMTGDNPGLANLMASVDSPQALQTLKQAQQGKSALAYALYAQGLLRSARAVLINQAELAPTEQQLVGRIDLTLASNDHAKLAEAISWLVKATQADPANIETHRLLQQTFIKTGDKSKADHQAELVKQLQSGKI